MSIKVANQASLEHFVRYHLFPGENIITNARAELSIKNPSTGLFLESDVWLPNLQLSFEFQDIYHFTTAWYRHSTVSQVLKNDDVKRDLFMRAGISLITVPCWWDINQQSLEALIKFHRPDIIVGEPNDADLTPLNPQENYWPPMSVPDVGEVMLASFLTSSSRLTTTFSNDPWWLGEKYDGIHFVVNPKKKNIFNRRGQDIPVPQSVIDLGVDTNAFLDGELWFGRKAFSESQLLYRGDVDIDQWSFLKMIVFDNAAFALQHEPFETRYSHVMDAIQLDYPVFIAAFRMLCTSNDILKAALKEIIVNSGGEGVMLRKRRSPYDQGRSSSLFKIKALRGDAEALVQKVAKAYVDVQMPSGKSIRIPKSSVVEGLHLKGGDIVTLEYDTTFRELPVDPVIARVRTDTLWETIVDESRRPSTTDVLAKAPRGYWKTQDGAQARQYLIDFARSKGLDPLLPATWYSLSYTAMRDSGASTGYINQRGGYVETIQELFPHIGLDPRQFSKDAHFAVVHNRRKFFDNYAKSRNFDPLIEDNWYSVDMADLMRVKGARTIGTYYGGIKSALRHLYPELNIDATKYSYQAEFYTKTTRRREVFNEFAAANKFDPLIPENWYAIARERIMALKNSPIVRTFYQKHLVKALLDVYPDIGLEPTKFVHLSPFWSVKKNQKAFFDEFAKENSFDPLIPTNWYNIARVKLLSKKGALVILDHYNQNHARALVSLYPDIGLELDKFGILPSGFWAEAQNRREFFDNFARAHGFDPLVANNWYSVSQLQILETKYSRIVLGYYKGSFVDALLTLYPTIGLDKLKFKNLPRDFWRDRSNRREFFDALAKDNGFDPLEPKNWYSLPLARIRERKMGHSILTRFEGNEFMAIIDAYPELALDEKKFDHIPMRYWADETNQKLFFDAYAKANNFDPLVADNWHRVKAADLQREKHLRTLLAYYNGSFISALSSLYPNIGIDRNKFAKLPNNYWKVQENRRKFFDLLANKEGFDALVPENWYKVGRTYITKHKGGEAVLAYYNDQVGAALMDVYPDIGLQRDRLKFSESVWLRPEARRKLFISFAEKKGFDPLVAANWYNLPKKEFMTTKGAMGMLSYYQGNYTRALLELFPDIGLDVHKFAIHRTGHWLVAENRKRFFDEFALKNGFDPLNAEAWYQVSSQSFSETKYADSVMKYYRHSVANALLHLYPNIGLNPEILMRPRDYWKKEQNRKAFFDDFARKNGFDPLIPSNWYKVSQHEIRAQKDSANALSLYQGNFVVALLKLYPNIGINVALFPKDSNIMLDPPPFSKRKFDPSMTAFAQLFPEIGKQTE